MARDGPRPAGIRPGPGRPVRGRPRPAQARCRRLGGRRHVDGRGRLAVAPRPGQIEVGDPAIAEQVAREALEIAEEHGLASTPTYAYGRSILGLILLRRGDVEAANEQLDRVAPGDPRARRAGVGGRDPALAGRGAAGARRRRRGGGPAARSGRNHRRAPRRRRPARAAAQDQGSPAEALPSGSRREMEVLGDVGRRIEAAGGRPALRVVQHRPLPRPLDLPEARRHSCRRRWGGRASSD